ncbi:MAG: hypothetical protein RDU01_00345 [Thermodesulfovibrionales bacterium]|nr:hypothetical protein [Thermodesulfovibrionales bacterium]
MGDFMGSEEALKQNSGRVFKEVDYVRKPLNMPKEIIIWKKG